jgi:hypothetical protein
MSATIHLFTGATRQAPPACPRFEPGDRVIIADYEWDAGDVQIEAIVISHTGDWVGVRVPDVGGYSVHVSRVYAQPAPEAA